MFPRHMTRRVWTASILGLAALVPLVSSCGQPAAQKPITVAAVVSDQAKYSLKTEATAMAAQTRAAVANATGIARDRAIVRMAQHRLSSYATATAVTIVRARARAAARRAAIAAATQTARVEAERARAQKTAQAFQAVQARQVAYAQTLETTVFSYCTPGVAALAGALSSGNRAMQAGRNISRGSLARVHRASKDFTLCIQYGEGPAYSASFHSV